jgi:penicillin-binding protein 2
MILVEDQHFRIRLLLLGMLGGFVLLAAVLWRMQVGHAARYASSLDQQSVRAVRLPALRGRLFDRHGVCLADNRSSYNVAVYIEELRTFGRRGVPIADRVSNAVARAAAAAGQPYPLTRTRILDHLYRRKPLPLTAWRDVNDTVLARLGESLDRLPGVDIAVEAVRVYPQGALAAHALGYVGRAEDRPEAEGEETYDYYLPDMTGKAGLEKRFDPFLSGRAGGRLVRVDASGYQHGELGYRPPTPGGDLLLTLDARIQRLAEDAIADASVPGAVVVLDPRCGDVLALASSPGFDPNDFSPAVPARVWNALLRDPRRPLINRATKGVYPPGSIFKPVVALAALSSGRLSPAEIFSCDGRFEMGNRAFACYLSIAHGPVNLRRALEVSCNVYFYQAGLRAGPEEIGSMAAAFGLGELTGLEIEENRGVLPGPEWKRRVLGDGWRDGDTCNLAIGQGALAVTPLQMAQVAACLANGGRVYRTRLVLGRRGPGEARFAREEPELRRQVRLPPGVLEQVRAGMRDVIQTPSGTGRLALLPGIVMAGKTGTAEYGRKQEGRKHGWMILFAPFEEPRYAVAMVMDEATSGGITIAPRMRQLMAGIFELQAWGGGS